MGLDRSSLALIGHLMVARQETVNDGVRAPVDHRQGADETADGAGVLPCPCRRLEGRFGLSKSGDGGAAPVSRRDVVLHALTTDQPGELELEAPPLRRVWLPVPGTGGVRNDEQLGRRIL